METIEFLDRKYRNVKKAHELFTAKEISQAYNISKSTIYQIINYKTWNYI